jgi:hypothetical protein
MKPELVAFIVGVIIGLWIGIRIGKGLAVFSLGHDIWNKLK